MSDRADEVEGAMLELVHTPRFDKPLAFARVRAWCGAEVDLRKQGNYQPGRSYPLCQDCMKAVEASNGQYT